jgi:6,7-dimethyl-8-ribityllumazine synthase
MAGIAPKRRIAAAARGQRFAVVVARFNEPISKKLLDGALAALADHAVAADAVEVHWVPGSFELAQAAQALARTRRFAGIVCVGAVIKGATPHFDYVFIFFLKKPIKIFFWCCLGGGAGWLNRG